MRAMPGSPCPIGLRDDISLQTRCEADPSILPPMRQSKVAGTISHSAGVIEEIDANGITHYGVQIHLGQCRVARPEAVVVPTTEGYIVVEVAPTKRWLKIERHIVP